MNTRRSEKGFTLIELLVVIGIIGLLASVVLVGLSGARRSGRDGRRIADLKQISTVLELYYNRCNFYPGEKLTSDTCPSPSTVDFDGMEESLEGSGLNINNIPHDPGAGTYEYEVTSSGQNYILKATLEDTQHRALQDDIDQADLPVGLTIDCADPAYCVGP